MEKIDFPWTTQEPKASLETEEKRTESFFERWIRRLRPYLPILALMAILLVLFLTRLRPQNSDAANFHHLEALVPVVAIPKGQEILPETLRPIAIERRDFSKSQLLQLAKLSDLDRLRGRLRAKKDIPPHHILFWSDLDFRSPVKTESDPRPQIFYPPKDGNSTEEAP